MFKVYSWIFEYFWGDQSVKKAPHLLGLSRTTSQRSGVNRYEREKSKGESQSRRQGVLNMYSIFIVIQIFSKLMNLIVSPEKVHFILCKYARNVFPYFN